MALCTLLVLGGVNAISWTLYRRAAEVLDAELDRRLLAVGRAAVPHLEELFSSGDSAGADRAAAFLARLRGDTRLEHAFVFDRTRASVADARAQVPPGTRYGLLRLDPVAVEEAWKGRAAASPHYEIEGLAFKGAYLPLRDRDGATVYVLYLEASVEFLSGLTMLRNVLLVAGGLSAALAILVAVALARGVRAVARATEARSRAEHLAVMGRLAAQVAHEVKNPLSTILGSAEVIEERYTLPREAKELLHGLREEVHRVNRLVEDFLALSPDVALARWPHDANELVNRVADMVASAGGSPEIKVLRELDPDLPKVSIDARRMHQVLLNLLLNAREAIGEGVSLRAVTGGASWRSDQPLRPVGTAGGVTVRTRRGKGDEVIIEVSDSGPGMSADILRRAFDPFFTTKEGGSGLGLAVARQIVEAHGGRLTLRSRPGQGTVCEVTLPFALGEPQESAVAI